MSENYIVFARKYRPLFFKDIIGQDHIIKILNKAIEKKRLGHALLFSGPHGTGKTTTARILARTVNCTAESGEKPCNPCAECSEKIYSTNNKKCQECDKICKSCKQYFSDQYADIIEIDGASHNKVEDIHELRDNIKFHPVIGRKKVYIIDEVHMLSNSAFNALLKTLEEPPDHVLFIFATTEIHKIPSTIISRCQRYNFHLLDINNIIEQLKIVQKKEKIKISDDALYLIAEFGNGSMRDSLGLFDQIVIQSEGKIDVDNVQEILGLVNFKYINKIVYAIINNNKSEILSTIDDIYYQGYNIEEFSKQLVKFYEQLLKLRTFKKKDDHRLAIPEYQLDTMTDIIMKVSSNTILTSLEFLIKLIAELKSSFNPKILLERTLTRIADFSDLLELNALKDMINSNKKIIDNAVKETIQKKKPNIAKKNNDIFELLKSYCEEKQLHSILQILENVNNIEKDNKKLVFDLNEINTFQKSMLDKHSNSIISILKESDIDINSIKVKAKNADNNTDDKEKKDIDYSDDPSVKKIIDVFGGKVTNVKKI